MPVLTNQLIPQNTNRTYHIHVPANPPQATVPAIIVFHGAGQDASNIAQRWGLIPGTPIPAQIEDYILVFPETDSRLTDAWVHFLKGNRAFPTLDLEFVDLLIQEITTTVYATGSATVPGVSADPGLIYAAGFSSGAGMVWQIVNSPLSAQFRGFAAVGLAAHPEKVRRYRSILAASGQQPPAVPLIYVHGTADFTFKPPATLQEVPLEMTIPAFTVRDMLNRNGFPPGAPATTTTLVPGSINVTEVVVQEFAGIETFSCVTVIHGGHNWPEPTSVGNPPVAVHYDATDAILDFWQTHAALP